MSAAGSGPAWAWAVRHWRLLLLAFALLALAAALVAPRVERMRPARDILAVVDVTGSMNVRDEVLEGEATSRLAMSKRGVRALLAALPCGSRLGLGIFTERRSFLLFEPAEVCSNFAALDGAIGALDWRMAWEGDSYVARGLHSGIALAEGVGADLVFLTDGHEAPPLAGDALPDFEGRPGEVRGLIVGVGGPDPVPIPKFDEDGREVGFYGEMDVPQENRSGPPPEDAHMREGWNPRNAPWGGEAARGTEHLSALREAHLQALSAQTGLGYVRLDAIRALPGEVLAATRARPIATQVDTAPLAGALALVALLALYGSALFIRLARRRRRHLPALHSGTLP